MCTDEHRVLLFGVDSVDVGQRIRGGRTHATVMVAFCTHTVSCLEVEIIFLVRMGEMSPNHSDLKSYHHCSHCEQALSCSFMDTQEESSNRPCYLTEEIKEAPRDFIHPGPPRKEERAKI